MMVDCEKCRGRGVTMTRGRYWTECSCCVGLQQRPDPPDQVVTIPLWPLLVILSRVRDAEDFYGDVDAVEAHAALEKDLYDQKKLPDYWKKQIEWRDDD